MTDHDHDIIGTPPPKRPETDDLPMFADFDGPPKLAMPGYGSIARDTAREKLEPHLSTIRAKVYLTIRDHGPITREEIAERSGIKENTINSAVAKLVELKLIRVTGLNAERTRGLLEVTGAEP